MTLYLIQMYVYLCIYVYIICIYDTPRVYASTRLVKSAANLGSAFSDETEVDLSASSVLALQSSTMLFSETLFSKMISAWNLRQSSDGNGPTATTSSLRKSQLRIDCRIDRWREWRWFWHIPCMLCTCVYIYMCACVYAKTWFCVCLRGFYSIAKVSVYNFTSYH